MVGTHKQCLLIFPLRKPHLVCGFPALEARDQVQSFLEGPLGLIQGYPGCSAGKESAGCVGDSGLILGLGRSPGEGNDYPLQYSCLENLTDGGAW